MNMELTALTRPRIASGVSSCTSICAHEHADHVARASNDEHRERQPEAGRQPEGDHADAEHRDAAEHPAPGMPLDRPHAEPERDDRRAHAGRGTQQSEAHAADVQNVVGEHRQQRDDAAEQHGEQIERDRAEHRLLAARRTRTRRARRASAIRATDLASTGFTPSIMNIATDQQCNRDAVRPVDAEDQREAGDGRAADGRDGEHQRCSSRWRRTAAPSAPGSAPSPGPPAPRRRAPRLTRRR